MWNACGRKARRWSQRRCATKKSLDTTASVSLFGCPLAETTQRSLTTSAGTIQRARPDAKNTTKRGGAT